MTSIIVLSQLGIILGALTLEIILLIALDIPEVRRFTKSIKNRIRHWLWKNFDWENDFVEK